MRGRGAGDVSGGSVTRWYHRQRESAGRALAMCPLPVPFPLVRRLVGVFTPIVQVAVLAVFHTRQDFPLLCIVALQFIRDAHPWDTPAAFEDLTEELFRCDLVAPALDQDTAHMAILIDGTPQVVALAIDGQKDLIEVLFMAQLWTSWPTA
jgi:hypothetical protein